MPSLKARKIILAIVLVIIFLVVPICLGFVMCSIEKEYLERLSKTNSLLISSFEKNEQDNNVYVYDSDGDFFSFKETNFWFEEILPFISEDYTEEYYLHEYVLVEDDLYYAIDYDKKEQKNNVLFCKYNIKNKKNTIIKLLERSKILDSFKINTKLYFKIKTITTINWQEYDVVRQEIRDITSVEYEEKKISVPKDGYSCEYYRNDKRRFTLKNKEGTQVIVNIGEEQLKLTPQYKEMQQFNYYIYTASLVEDRVFVIYGFDVSNQGKKAASNNLELKYPYFVVFEYDVEYDVLEYKRLAKTWVGEFIWVELRQN